MTFGTLIAQKMLYRITSIRHCVFKVKIKVKLRSIKDLDVNPERMILVSFDRAFLFNKCVKFDADRPMRNFDL